MAESESSPGWPVGDQADWRLAYELLQAGQYGQVAELLVRRQAACEQSGDTSLAQILAAAQRISLACSQCRAEAEWHQQAFQETDQREHELRQQLQAILDLISAREEPGTHEERQTPLAPTYEPSSSERTHSAPPKRPSLWQRVQGLLGWVPSPQPVEGDAALRSVVSPPPSFARKSKRPVASHHIPETKAANLSFIESEKQGRQTPPSLSVYCLGPFRVYQDDQPIQDWRSSKGKAIFKHLIAHRERPVAKEVLMELFWPGAHPDAARNNLNVAIYGLRQALRQARPSFSHVLFEDDCYSLNPDLQIWVDVEEFMERLRAAHALERRGDLPSAMREYRAAEILYEGEFLEEDRYEDWPVPQRGHLRENYLDILDRLSRHYCDQGDDDACVNVCRKMLAVDPCREEAHRRLMRCYSRQGQSYLALRQYHKCVETLKEELDVPPAPATTSLYTQIRRGKQA
jgi:DNA-binding SARP family transcriptional activator